MLNISEHPSIRKGKSAVSTVEIGVSVERARMEKWLAERINKEGSSLEIVTLTPVLASLLLERNLENRSFSEVNLARIKADIIGNRFIFNGESMVVSSSGHLNDGQHRCRAVMETNKSIETVIVFGAPRDSRMTINQGIPRTVAHYLSMHGFRDANMLAGVAGHVWCYRTYTRLTDVSFERPTKSQVVDVITHYRDIIDSVTAFKAVSFNLPSKVVSAFAHWAFSQAAGSDRANEFITKLGSGANLSEGSPILYCRSRLMEERRSSSQAAKAELLFKCWNAWRRGDVTKRINIMGGKLPGLER